MRAYIFSRFDAIIFLGVPNSLSAAGCRTRLAVVISAIHRRLLSFA